MKNAKGKKINNDNHPFVRSFVLSLQTAFYTTRKVGLNHFLLTPANDWSTRAIRTILYGPSHPYYKHLLHIYVRTCIYRMDGSKRDLEKI